MLKYKLQQLALLNPSVPAEGLPTALRPSTRRKRTATGSLEPWSRQQVSILPASEEQRRLEIGSTGKPAAFDFIMRHEGDLQRIARREAKGIDPEEIASEARMMLIDRWQDYRPGKGSAATWIFWQVRAARQKIKRARDSRSHRRIPGDLASALSRDRLDTGEVPEMSPAVLQEITVASSAGRTEAAAILRDVLRGHPPDRIAALLDGGQAGQAAAAQIKRIHHARNVAADWRIP